LSTFGSLKDLIYKTEPFQDYSKKYQQNGSGLPIEDIKDFGRQILKGIKGIIDCGFSFPNLCLFSFFKTKSNCKCHHDQKRRFFSL
jgi:hypothetical protein